ncbi:MAG TPA: VWA domain-containing protein [Thermoplasmata archaeon]|nr:VWA domain-containing protein [Thermoplasmata archaeon]
MNLWTLLVLSLPLVFLGPGTAPVAQAFCEIAEPPSSIPTQVNGTQVEILLTEGHARVVIMKEFHNPSTVFKEGQVFFPLERGHELITDLRLQVGNVTYESSAVDRGEGLDAFLTALTEGTDAALVQYDERRDVYWIAVTIPPGQTRTTITTLEMPLTSWDGVYEYPYRLSVDARHSVDYLRVRVRVETASALLEVWSPSHLDLTFERDGDRVAEARIDSRSAAGARDLVVRFRSEGPSLSQSVDEEGNRYVRWSMGVDDPAIAESQRPWPRTLLVLVDGSGSMAHGGRRDLVRAVVRSLGADLRPGERIGLTVFHGREVVPFDESPAGWYADLAEAMDDFLAAATLRGSTNLAAPLSLIDRWGHEAVAERHQPVLILISDGHVTAGPAGPDLVNAYSRVAYAADLPVFTIAVEPPTHQDENLLVNLSHFHGGRFAAPTLDMAAEISRDLLRSVRVPVLEGVRIDVPDAVEDSWAVPTVQTVRSGGEILALARLRGTSSDPLAVQISWEDGRRSIEKTVSGDQIPIRSNVERQWALAQIQSLLARLRAEPNGDAEAELKALATSYRVATPFTSLFVTLPRTDGEAPAPNAALVLAPGLGPSLLEAEARRVEAYRRDLGSDLVVQGEVDRFVKVSSPEYRDLFPKLGATVYRGSFLSVHEVDGGLVGVFRGWLDPPAVAPQGFAVALAGLAGCGIVFLERSRRKDEERSRDSVRS